MKHDFKQYAGFTYQCSKCREMDTIGVDPCDADGIMAELERMNERTDCRGRMRKPRRRKTKTKTVFTRRELFVVGENHGGYLAGHCALCESCGWLGKIEHKPNCLFADPKVTDVKMEGMTT